MQLREALISKKTVGLYYLLERALVLALYLYPHPPLCEVLHMWYGNATEKYFKFRML